MNSIDRKDSLKFLVGLSRLIEETGVVIANDTATDIGLYNEATGRFMGSFIVENDRVELYCGDDEPIAIIERGDHNEPN